MKYSIFSESEFVVALLKKTPITKEVLERAKIRAERAKNAKSAKFLDKYRLTTLSG